MLAHLSKEDDYFLHFFANVVFVIVTNSIRVTELFIVMEYSPVCVCMYS